MIVQRLGSISGKRLTECLKLVKLLFVSRELNVVVIFNLITAEI